jgi:hypothetical protein
MGCLFLIILSAAGVTGDFAIPDDAQLCAERYLELDWKPAASRNPSFYNVPVDLNDLSSAAIGIGYHFFVLSPGSTRAYVSSNVEDPRGFASQHVIHFPVLAESTMLCVVEVFQIDGEQIELEESCGVFFVRGCASGGHLKEYHNFQSVPEEYGLSDATLSVVNFWTPGGETWYMFPTPSGAHIVFYRRTEHFLDRTAAQFKRDLKRRWEEEQD